MRRMDRELFVKIRKLNGYTQYEFAALLGLSRSHVAKIEIGERALSQTVEDKVREHFGTKHIREVRAILNKISKRDAQ